MWRYTDMAITDAGVTMAGATAPTVADSKAKGNKAFQDFKAKGQAIRESEGYDKAIESQKSGAIQFISCLGNPARTQKRTEAGQNKDSCQVIGYKLKALEPIEVPVAKIIDKSKPMAHGEITYKQVAAGEEFDVSLFELGALISKPEYAGKFTGGGDEVVLHITMSKGNDNEPLTVLKRKGSPLKDTMIKVATESVNAENGKKTYSCLPEYEEKFGVYFVRKSGPVGGSKASKPQESAQDLAAAFQAYLASQASK